MAAGALMSSLRVTAIPQAASDGDDMETAMQMLRQCKLKTPEDGLAREEIFRSFKALPPETHTNLASFVLEKAAGAFAANTAIVDGASGTRYSYAQVRA